MVFRLALETPDGVLNTFNAPEPWSPSSLLVSINGIVQTYGFTAVSGTAVQFSVIPDVGDTIGFLYPT